jgi:site-specific recombinase XerD
MGYSVKVQLRDHYIRKDGKTNFKLSVYLEGKRKFYPIDVYIEPKYWNGTKILSSNVHNKEYNGILKDSLVRAEQIILDLQREQKELTVHNFETYYFSDSKRNDVYTIEKAYDKYIEYYSSLKKSSLDIYRAEKNKLTEYAGKSFPLANVDEVFYMNYRKHLIDKKGHQQNTLTKVIKKLKAVINFSVKMGLLKENKLAMVTEKEQETHRESLSIEELDKLEAFLESDKISGKLKDVLISFLFSCYSSIRYTDMSMLQYKNIEDNFIVFNPIKTEYESQRKLQVPITPRCKRIIDKYGNKERGSLFKTISNQKENDYLRIIMMYEAVKIERHITFHCARHTFAMNALNFGMPIEYLQKILGHTKKETTEIYAKYKKAILQEMSDKYLNY